MAEFETKHWADFDDFPPVGTRLRSKYGGTATIAEVDREHNPPVARLFYGTEKHYTGIGWELQALTDFYSIVNL